MTISLLRVRIENSVKISRYEMGAALSLTSLNGAGRGIDDLLPRRPDSDALRNTISFVLNNCPAIQHDGSSMRIIRAEAKTAGKGDAQIDLHFQRRGSTVNYVRIGSFTLISGYIKWTYDEDLSPYWKGKVPEYLEDWFSRCGEIVEFGNNLFSHDVRKLVDILLVEALPKLWAGTWLVMSDEHANKSRLLRQVLKNASLNSVGKASINLINLENSSENKEHIGKELSDNYRDKIQDLIEEIGSLDTSMDPVKYEKKKGVISNAFSSVVAESDSIQDSLSVTFGDDFYEALAAMSQLL